MVKCLKKLSDLKVLCICLLQKGKRSKLADLYCDNEKLSTEDILKKISTLNVPFQHESDALTMSKKAIAFQRKLERAFWKQIFGNGLIVMQFCCKKLCKPVT